MPLLQDFAALFVRFRKNLLYLGLYILLVSVIAFPFTGDVIMRMSNDLLPQQKYSGELYQLIQTQPLELMMLELKLSVIAGVIAALPVVFFYAYRFLAGRQFGDRFRISGPKLLLATAVGLVLFIVGCLYSYWLMLPLVFEYLLTSSLAAGVANSWKVSDFVNFAVMTTAVFGLVFELPLAMTVLARARIVPAWVFRKYRRHMYIVILIVAALVTSPDVLTQIMVGIPLIIFYELSLLILRFTAPDNRPPAEEKASGQ
ncbi:twin-arginine translocase subunit TatC [Methanocella arvoryzae]|uniref:Sec-independent protein translocase protein TatC n=1 Tax=Methanocella arvoryzae (strain DSM 22066 / NBRC 105507 / MRE50) TaxID=351160 RepID=Q0W4Y5_METAR|nr:twin-arginine translocase subunit TatC [Methanocella arvoryzae]CAJ36558.1 sec-independent periplasmic protein translocase [Methanocella arvoryzae MRE50]